MCSGSHPLAAAQGPDAPALGRQLGGHPPRPAPPPPPPPPCFPNSQEGSAALASRRSLGLPLTSATTPPPKPLLGKPGRAAGHLCLLSLCRALAKSEGSLAPARALLWSPVPRVRLERVLVPGQRWPQARQGEKAAPGAPTPPRSCQALGPVGAGCSADSEGPGPGAPIPPTARGHGPRGPPPGGWDRQCGLGPANCGGFLGRFRLFSELWIHGGKSTPRRQGRVHSKVQPQQTRASGAGRRLGCSQDLPSGPPGGLSAPSGRGPVGGASARGLARQASLASKRRGPLGLRGLGQGWCGSGRLWEPSHPRTRLACGLRVAWLWFRPEHSVCSPVSRVSH